MKIARLVGGSDLFIERVKAACWVYNVEYDDGVLRAVVTDTAVLAATALTDGTTIDASAVQDSDIERVVSTFGGTSG